MPCHVLIILLSFLPVHAQNFRIMSKSFQLLSKPSSSWIFQRFLWSLWDSTNLLLHYPLLLRHLCYEYFGTFQTYSSQIPSSLSWATSNPSVNSINVPSLFSGLCIYAVLFNYIYENTTGIVFFIIIYIQIKLKTLEVGTSISNYFMSRSHTDTFARSAFLLPFPCIHLQDLLCRSSIACSPWNCFAFRPSARSLFGVPLPVIALEHKY